MANHECELCVKTFSSSSSLRRHLRRAHPESEAANLKPKNLREKSVVCPLCRATLSRYQDLVEHLTAAHDLPMKEEAHDFLTVGDFLKWKQLVEKVTESLFVKLRGTSAVKSVRGTKDIYVCHRSGRPRGKSGERIRQPKSQGSQKLDAFCPARMKVVTTEGGRVFLNFLPTHVGHSTDPIHLRLSRSEREMLAKKMADQRSLDDILREIHDSPEPLGRLKLLSKQDLQNISRDANLLASVYSSAAIGDWVDQQRPGGNVLLYKPKGDKSESYSTEDFVLCIVNPKKPSSEFVCFDAFETTSINELNLFVISAAGETASPIAAMISNRKDHQILDLFLEKTAAHLDTASYLFCPRNHQFHDAWRNRFSQTQTVIGSWQIEHEWRVNLAKMIKNKAKKLEIYRALKSLMEAPSENDFRLMVENIHGAAKNESAEFKPYFDGVAACFKDWIRFRRSLKVTKVNGMFEKLHKTLKSAYLRFKAFETVQALASSVVEIMNYRQDGGALREISARHRTAAKNEFTITLESENLWKVAFQGPREATWEVERADFTCDCRSKCEECKFCQHAFKCACPDGAKGNMCKHVHAVCMSLFSDREITVEEEAFEELEPEPEAFEVVISEAITSEEVEDGKLELQQDFGQILSMIRTVEDVNLVRNAFRLITPSLGLNKETLPLVVENKDDIS